MGVKYRKFTLALAFLVIGLGLYQLIANKTIPGVLPLGLASMTAFIYLDHRVRFSEKRNLGYFYLAAIMINVFAGLLQIYVFLTK